MRRVLDDGHAVTRGDGLDLVERHRGAAVVHDEDGASARRHRRGNSGAGDVAGVGVDVGPARRRAGVTDREIGRLGGHRRRHHVVARLHAGEQQREMQGRRARLAGQHARIADELAEAALEVGDRLALADLAAVEHFLQPRQQRRGR